MTERLYTQQEIADLIGVTRRAVHKRSSMESWPVAERRKVRGGEAIVHAFEDIPRAFQKKIENAEKLAKAKAHVSAIETEHAREMAEAGASLGELEAEKRRREDQARIDRIAEGRKKFSALAKDDKKRRRAKAREWIVAAAAQHHREMGGTKESAQGDFALKVVSGDIPIPGFVAEFLPRRHGRISLSEGTVQRWSDDYRDNGMWGLVDGYGHNAGNFKVVQNPELYRLVLGAMVKDPHIKAKRIIEFLEAQYPHLKKAVSERRLQSFMEWWKNDNSQLWTYITNPDRWKNVFMAAAGSVFERITRLNQLWELDSTPGDWMLKDGRHSVVGAIDLYSRRMKFYVSKTSTAAAVKQLLRRCLLDWGVPEGVRTDNGADYVSEEVDGLLRDLQIVHEVCIPFASEEKGTIERSMRTMSHGLLELLPGFIGHSVADRKAIEARKAFADRVMKRGDVVEVSMTSSELQAKLDEWTEFVYGRNPHGGLDGKSPWEVANAWREPIRAISDEHALDELLTAVGGTRVITKKGIRYDNRFFIDPTGRMYENECMGREVVIRVDEHDIGKLAVYLDGAFLCWAVDPDAVGIERKEAAAAIKHHQKKMISEQAQELKKYTREIKTDIVQAVIDHRKAQAENVSELPKRAEEYVTPALNAAAQASRERSGTPYEPRQPAEVRDIRSAAAAHNARVSEEQDGRKVHAQWLRVEGRIAAGELVSADERRGLEIYKRSGVYESMEEFFSEFGLTAADFG